ncbi:hypothetical protein [Parvibaculum sp.]|uniref:hypothetical protein n=1 Tax=Parvibaculum sp. TaxID=2024848 RepID=UPI00320D8086
MNPNDIARHLTGAWRIARRDPEAAKYFDLSAAGFFRSFAALALALPLILVASAALWRMGQTIDAIADLDFTSFATVQMGGEALNWIVYLTVMAAVARHLELGASYSAYVITFNWGVLMTSGLMLLPLGLFLIGIIGDEFAVMLTLPVFLLAAWYRWQIAREVLGATPSAAMAILILDFVLGALLDQGLSRLLLTPVGA